MTKPKSRRYQVNLRPQNEAMMAKTVFYLVMIPFMTPQKNMRCFVPTKMNKRRKCLSKMNWKKSILKDLPTERAINLKLCSKWLIFLIEKLGSQTVNYLDVMSGWSRSHLLVRGCRASQNPRSDSAWTSLRSGCMSEVSTCSGKMKSREKLIWFCWAR